MKIRAFGIISLGMFSIILTTVITVNTGCVFPPPSVPTPLYATPTLSPTVDLTPNPTAAPNSTPVTWTGNTVNTCAQFQAVTVTSYIVQTDFWNPTSCGGTQCVNINNATGAFNVYQGPTNCGSQVTSYPNIFTGNEEGYISPGGALPKQISALNSVTSSWNFTPGGTSTDQWDIAYDIWLGPTASCTSSSTFPCGGTELMIWVDYLNTTGWQTDDGPVTLSGSDWELWNATQTSGSNSWTYLAYLAKSPSSIPVANLNILAFIQDAINRGYIQSSWYLYSIPAGIELRTGGIPFTSNSFSVAIQ